MYRMIKNMAKGITVDSLDNERIDIIDPQYKMDFFRMYRWRVLFGVVIGSLVIYIFVNSL